MAILSPDTVDTTLLQDGQTLTITAAAVRTMNDSASGIFASVQTTSYTLVMADRGTCIEMNSASGVNLTIPPNSTAAFDVGTDIEIYQMGAGQVTFVPGAGVTLRTASSLTTRVQFATAGLRKRATNEWIVTGDLT